jgi:hypothetical protein
MCPGECMTSNVVGTEGSSNTGIVQPQSPASGDFMITLCELELPMHIRQPESPHLKPYTFFVGRTRRADGTVQLALHMGYFQTLEEAQTWVRRVHGRYPNATAQRVPAEFLPASDAEPATRRPTDVANGQMTDTQVMNVLEARGAAQLRGDGADVTSAQIPLVRPEDTTTRRVLKEAVAHGAPVSFAVQLQFSAVPIDLNRVQSHGLFKGRLLYVAVSRREARSSYFLRLGFFADPVSAKQGALQLRAKFPSAAVVPVTEDERVRARELRVEVAVAAPSERKAPQRTDAGAKARAAAEKRRATARVEESLDQTLETLAQRERLADPDSISESGVRHLKVEVQRR